MDIQCIASVVVGCNCCLVFSVARCSIWMFPASLILVCNFNLGSSWSSCYKRWSRLLELESHQGHWILWYKEVIQLAKFLDIWYMPVPFCGQCHRSLNNRAMRPPPPTHTHTSIDSTGAAFECKSVYKSYIWKE
jgi:hypothetical protein